MELLNLMFEILRTKKKMSSSTDPTLKCLCNLAYLHVASSYLTSFLEGAVRPLPPALGPHWDGAGLSLRAAASGSWSQP